MTQPTQNDYDFDIALSFAGENREYVEEVNNALKAAGIRTFLDSDYLSEMWEEDLVEFFDGIYRKRSRFAILFISRHYADKMWPREERRSALARALEERSAYVLPVRLDDSQIEGLRPTVGYLDARRTGIEGLVEALLGKLSGLSTPRGGWPGDRAPRTQQEVDDVRKNQPPGWEYLYFAGLLRLGVDALKAKYLDHELGFAPPSGEHIETNELFPFIHRVFDEAAKLVKSLDQLMAADVQERAFGPPGVPGDPERIHHLAVRWNSCYEGLLDWSTRLRASSHGAEFDVLFDLLAQFVDGPIDQYKNFVDEFVKAVDQIPSVLATKQPLNIQIVLVIAIREGLKEEYEAELDRLLAQFTRQQ